MIDLSYNRVIVCYYLYELYELYDLYNPSIDLSY